jgi:hypothetical protein
MKGGPKTMDDAARWSTAFSRFSDFVRNLPVLLDADDVEQYHQILDLFEDTLDTDLSRFKVRDDRMKSAIQNPVPCWQTKLPERVERSQFVAKIWHFAHFLKSNIATPPTDTYTN